MWSDGLSNLVETCPTEASLVGGGDSKNVEMGFDKVVQSYLLGTEHMLRQHLLSHHSGHDLYQAILG